VFSKDPYLPHRYLGEAYYRQGRCREALNSWDQSQMQGELAKVKDGLNTVRTLSTECEKKGFLLRERLDAEYQRVRVLINSADATTLAKELKGKIVLDAGNPYPSRDGDMAVKDRARGTGAAAKEYFPGVRIVRAFNSINASPLLNDAFHKPEKLGIPIASDDAEALKIASQLVSDAGFDPVVVGDLSRAREFDVGTPVYTQGYTAAELRKALKLP
jgi:hypothetical protein